LTTPKQELAANCLSDDGEGHVLLDVADVAVHGGHVEVDVTSVTPAGSPRVSDNPIGLRSGTGESDGLNAVVDLSWALFQDTSGVVLPGLSSNAD